MKAGDVREGSSGPLSGGPGPALMAESFGSDLRHPRALVPACLLLFLTERPGHGYELIDRLRALGLPPPARASVYRYLRLLEEAGLVSSQLQTREAGPSRTVYRVTPAGRKALDRCAVSVGQLLCVLHQLLDRQRATVASG